MAVVGALSVSQAELRRHPLRTFALALAVGAALSIVLLLQGFHSGLIEQLRQMVLGRGADLVVVQAGIANFVAARSKLPQTSRGEVEAVAGVDSADPMMLVPVIFDRQGRKAPIFFLVYDQKGGPSRLLSGHHPREPGDVIADEALAAMFQLRLGDDVTVSDYEFRIAGIAERASAMFTSVMFVTYDELIDFYFGSDLMGDMATLPLLSFLLVDIDEDADIDAVRTRLEETIPSIDVFLPEELGERDANMGRALFGPVIGVLIVISYLITLAVIGMILYANASGRSRSYGVLMALGFAPRTLLSGMIAESLCVAALAIPLAILIASGVGAAIESQAPLYLITVLDPAPLARAIAGAFALSIAGSALAYGRIAGLDPASAFRS